MTPEQYKEIRGSLGTQAEVAAMLETARETIARRETGKDRITKEAALALFGLSKLSKNQRTSVFVATLQKNQGGFKQRKKRVKP